MNKLKVKLFFWCILTSSQTELWEKDVSEDMKIGPSLNGYERVVLRCGANSMKISVVTNESFSGVLYTRGSYGNENSPCFKNPVSGKEFNLEIPFNMCQTTNESGLYKNVLIIQHDDDLIMPGDAAFNLECDFRKDKEIHVNYGFELGDVLSKITLSDADPSAQTLETSPSVRNNSFTVTFMPRRIRLVDEL